MAQFPEFTEQTFTDYFTWAQYQGELSDYIVTFDASGLQEQIDENAENIQDNTDAIDAIVSGGLPAPGDPDQALTLDPTFLTPKWSTIDADWVDLGESDDVQFASIIAGDPGFEGSGIDIGGTVFNSTFKVSDIGGTNPAQTILHRHSTTLPPAIIGARSHSNDATHTIVVDGDNLLDIFAVGWDGNNYKIAASVRMEVDGVPGSNDMPGRIILATTENGGITHIDAVEVDSDQKLKLLVNPLEVTEGGSDARTASQARINFGLEIGVDVQAFDAGLQSISGLTTLADKMIFTTASDVYATTDLTVFARTLLDDTTQGAMQTTLNVDPAGTDNSVNVTFAGSLDYLTLSGQQITLNAIDLTTDITGILPLASGGTGDAAVTSANIGHVKAMNQDVGTGDDHTMNKSIVNDTTDASVAGTGAGQVAGGLDVRKTIITGTGIKIGGTGESNRLDFFRELGWIPVGVFAAGSGTITYATQAGTSTRIGDTVLIRGRLTFTSIASRTGNFTITGLPYTSAAQLQSVNIIAFGLNLASAGQSLTGFVGASSTTINVFVWNNINGANALTDAEMTDTTDLIFDIQYKAA